jgi:ATP/maltotriose-dependent transcriptional regulator MalT
VSRPTPSDEDLGILAQVWEAERVLDYPKMRDLLESLPAAKLLETEEFVILLMLAYSRTSDASKGADLLQLSAPLFPHTRQDRTRIRFLGAAAEIYMDQGRFTEADRLAHEIQDYAYKTRDGVLAVHASMIRGNIAGHRGDFLQSLGYFSRALASVEQHSTRWIPVLHHNIGVTYRELGFIAEAERHFELSSRQARPEWMQAITNMDRAILRLMVGDPAAARELAYRGMTLLDGIQSQGGMAEAHCILGRIAAAEGHTTEARQELTSALSLVAGGNLLLLAQIYEEVAALELIVGNQQAREEAEATAERYYKQLDAAPRVKRMKLRLEELSIGATASD